MIVPNFLLGPYLVAETQQRPSAGGHAPGEVSVSGQLRREVLNAVAGNRCFGRKGGPVRAGRNVLGREGGFCLDVAQARRMRGRGESEHGNVAIIIRHGPRLGERALEVLRAGDVVLVKGSASSQMARVIWGLEALEKAGKWKAP